jgi:hypothetical protein
MWTAFSKRGDHGCAELVHTSTPGSIQEESSSDPALMRTSSGNDSATLKTGDLTPLIRVCRGMRDKGGSATTKSDA